MTDLDYRKLYCEIYNNSLTYTKYIPVRSYLYKIIHSYREAMSEELDFTKDLISFFDMVIDNNKYDKLDEYINFIINLHTPWYDVADFLKVIVFPLETYTNKNVYYQRFEEICNVANNKFDKEKFNNLRIEEILKMYKKYHDNIPTIDINTLNMDKKIYFERYASIIIAYFYLTDKPINYLDNIFNNFVNNYEDVRDKSYLAGISDLNYCKSSLGKMDEYEYFELLTESQISNDKGIIK
jgi:hypothetical protein